MNDSEIIKALTTSSDPNNLNCQPTTKLCKEALDLIKRQQAEIERLKKLLEEADINYNKCAKRFYKEGVKEFAERLKKIYAAHDGLAIIIDRLVEEMGCNDG